MRFAGRRTRPLREFPGAARPSSEQLVEHLSVVLAQTVRELVHVEHVREKPLRTDQVCYRAATDPECGGRVVPYNQTTFIGPACRRTSHAARASETTQSSVCPPGAEVVTLPDSVTW